MLTRLGGDGNLTRSHGSHHTILYGSDGCIRGLPCHGLVGSVVGRYGSSECQCLALGEGSSGLVEGNARYGNLLGSYVHSGCHVAECVAHGSGGSGVHGVEACLATRGILGSYDGDGEQGAIGKGALIQVVEHHEQVARCEGIGAQGVTLGSCAKGNVASEGEALGEREVKLQGGHLRCALNGYGNRSFLSCLGGDVRHGEALCHRATYDKRQHGKYG